MDRARPAVRTNQGEKILFELGPEVGRGLRKVARQEQATLQMVMLGVWQVLLSRLGGVEDITEGIAASGRDRPELEEVSGMFVNTLTIQNRPEKEKRFAQYQKEVREATLKGSEHSAYPFEALVDRLEGISRV